MTTSRRPGPPTEEASRLPGTTRSSSCGPMELTHEVSAFARRSPIGQLDRRLVPDQLCGRRRVERGGAAWGVPPLGARGKAQDVADALCVVLARARSIRPTHRMIAATIVVKADATSAGTPRPAAP